MNIETRKINLINWISTIQGEDIINKVENIQKEASDWYESILKYIVGKFGTIKAVEVDMYIERVIDMIAVNPKMFPHSDKMKAIRRCVISPRLLCTIDLPVNVLN